MRAIVEGLLVLARVDEGGLELLAERVDLLELGRAVAAGVAPLAAERGVRIDVDGERRRRPATASGSASALGNLVDNAVKASPAGAVVRSTAFRAQDAVGVAVGDRGPGHPGGRARADLRALRAARRRRGREQGGSGLGLAICREIAAAHGGHGHGDELGRGQPVRARAAILITLPVAQAS